MGGLQYACVSSGVCVCVCVCNQCVLCVFSVCVYSAERRTTLSLRTGWICTTGSTVPCSNAVCNADRYRHTHTHIHTHTHTHTCPMLKRCVQCRQVQKHTVHTHTQYVHTHTQYVHTHTHTLTHTIYTHTHTHTHTHTIRTHTHTHTHKCIPVRTPTHTRTCMHTH